jgi:hypothetical protein
MSEKADKQKTQDGKKSKQGLGQKNAQTPAGFHPSAPLSVNSMGTPFFPPIEQHVLLLSKINSLEASEFLMSLQRTYGNRYVQRLLRSVESRSKPEIGIFINDSKKSQDEISIPEEYTPTVQENLEESKQVPHVFINNGKRGSATVHWAGGTGGTVPEGFAVADVIPLIEVGSSRAWVRPGTGTITVTRSFIGINIGANGTYYVTERAVNRIDQHEELHIRTANAHHDTYIVPMEARIAQYTGDDNAMAGDNDAAARTALKAFIRWDDTLTTFKAADRADNIVGGTVDTAELATPDYPQDFGPRSVESASYAHYIDVPPGPTATAESATGSAATSTAESTSESE